MKIFGFCILLFCICFSCKTKKKVEVDNSNYFPVLAFMQGQVKKIDTSLYSITKIVTVDGVTDSTPIPRDSVRSLAREFLDLPDLRSEKGKDYTEVHDYDTTTSLGSWIYTSEETDVPKMQVFFVKSGLNFDDVVTTVYIEKENEKGGRVVLKRLLWDIQEHYFQVKTITSKKNNPDRIEVLRVSWQDFQSN